MQRLKDDHTRYNYLILFHAIDALTFLIRFIILCTDLSAANSDSLQYLIPILLLEFATSLVIFIADLIYVYLKYVGPILYETEQDDICVPRKYVWRFSTLTCFKCDCYQDLPQTVTLTRVIILGSCVVVRFVLFILGAVCANKYSPRGIAYTVIASFSLVISSITVIIEYLHHRRPWYYRPSNDYTVVTRKEHLRYIPYDLVNDQRTIHWRSSLCERGTPCNSRNLHHVLFYHSSNVQYRPEETRNNQTVVGFHQTSRHAAYAIAREGFLHSRRGMLGEGVYFATSIDHTQFKANHFGAFICAKVDLGNTRRITSAQLKARIAVGPEFDTVYLDHELGNDEFCVRNTAQIRSWIISASNERRIVSRDGTVDAPITDEFDARVYEGCF
ncbi:unnamed protein product [Didymodactylos carnosus]|uniref:PARP catalytic domain-containing protein n=1 Tax=Didymodactylos carnosus TaxID=1234261 RepID=A0A814WJN5_9BILA|nr:unnamed protein product [Didymodactylos carnosus]CAF1203274.1 unnamed protein product [Didymodactylos carnosus]CAF3852498.1 unnamed protein product [Didymodactylos carnosus]CAF3967624.1 unnamed protein product [Didymodactylos carnosus]